MKLWAGLVELRADPKCKTFRRFGDDRGAFAWVVAWAESQTDFEQKAKMMSETLDCVVYGIENIGLLEDKMKSDDYPDEFVEMRQTAYRQPSDTIFGPFYTWAQDDVI